MGHGLMPMVIPPHVLREVEREPRPPDPALRGQLALQVPPEALEAVDVRPAGGHVRALRVIHQAVDVPLRGDPRVAPPRVGADDRPRADPAADQGEQGGGLDIRDELGPDVAAAAEDPKHGGLGRPPAVLHGPAPLGGPEVPAAAPEVRLIHLDHPAEDRGDILGHRLPDARQGPEDPAAVQPGLGRDPRAAQPEEEPAEHGGPLPGEQPEGQARRTPLVPALGTAVLLAPNRVALFVTAPGTRNSLCHTQILANLVAGM